MAKEAYIKCPNCGVFIKLTPKLKSKLKEKLKIKDKET